MRSAHRFAFNLFSAPKCGRSHDSTGNGLLCENGKDGVVGVRHPMGQYYRKLPSHVQLSPVEMAAETKTHRDGSVSPVKMQSRGSLYLYLRVVIVSTGILMAGSIQSLTLGDLRTSYLCDNHSLRDKPRPLVW